jgi:hypothetical protein
MTLPCIAASGYWPVSKNPRWVRTLSRQGVTNCITASTSVLARSYATRGSRVVCAEDRWKKFLSLMSRAGSENAP